MKGIYHVKNPGYFMDNTMVTVNIIALIVSALGLLLAIVGTYVHARIKIAKLEVHIAEVKEDVVLSRQSREKVWGKLSELAATMHRIEIALVNKVDRK